MSTVHIPLSRCLMCALAIGAAAVLYAASAPEPVAAQVPSGGGAAAASLPRVSDLPAGFQPAGEIAGRGMFYAEGGRPAYRLDDGTHYHGYDAPIGWSKMPKPVNTQGVLYGVDGDSVVSAGYLLRQADLTASRSFRGLTLRGLDFPAAHSFTTDFVPDETTGNHLYLLLWHFRPFVEHGLPYGQLPPRSILPPRFTVFACDQFAEVFCPGMGRHFTDLSRPAGRMPSSPGDDGVIYGEAAGKLIFIEYVLGKREFAEGVSWPEMPLHHLAIPPIDDVHVLHFGSPGSMTGRYTVHMYFMPEATYLSWQTEPPQL
ncbi:MAG: hypothetical protein F4057_09630 [Acidobacteria bacterium]|nr:hypothetical protein [Acidobacteriota bacterium]